MSNKSSADEDEDSDVADEDDVCVSDSGGEETVPGNWEASAGFQQAGVCAGSVEVEERVRPHIHLDDLCLVCPRLNHFCSLVQERRRDLPATEEAGSLSGLDPSLFHPGSSRIYSHCSFLWSKPGF